MTDNNAPADDVVARLRNMLWDEIDVPVSVARGVLARIRELEDGLSRAASAMEAEAVVLRSAQLAPSCVDALERKAARARALIERNSK